MSSGEAEYSGVVKGASIGMGVQSMYEDYNEKMKLIVFTDSSTARSITQRRGIGKIRHLETRLLWVQHYVYNQLLRVEKIATAENPADLFTKFLDEKRTIMLLKKMGFEYRSGRPKAAKQVMQ